MSGIVKVDVVPPASIRGSSARRDIAVTLTNDVDQWYRVFLGKKGSSRSIADALNLSLGYFHGNEFEAVTRTEDGETAVYARCLRADAPVPGAAPESAA